MSAVKLISFVTYMRNHPPKQVILNNIPMPDAFKAPEGALVTFYGFHDSLEDLARWRREADHSGMDLCSIEMTADIGESVKVHLTEENIKDTHFMKFNRLHTDLEAKIIQYFRGYMAEEGISSEQMNNMEWRHQNYVIERPDLLARLRQEPEFKHIDVMVYPTKDFDGHIRQKTALFNEAAVTKIVAFDEPSIQVHLPKLGGHKVEKRLAPTM